MENCEVPLRTDKEAIISQIFYSYSATFKVRLHINKIWRWRQAYRTQDSRAIPQSVSYVYGLCHNSWN